MNSRKDNPDSATNKLAHNDEIDDFAKTLLDNDYAKSGEYRATTNWPYHISAGGAVYRTRESCGSRSLPRAGARKSGTEVLLLFRETPDGKHFHLPKGTLGFGEILETCARREIIEESGASVELRGYLGATLGEFMHPRWQVWISKTTHYFAVEFREFSREHDFEHDGAEWFPLKTAREKLAKTEPNKQEYLILDRLEKFLSLAK